MGLASIVTTIMSTLVAHFPPKELLHRPPEVQAPFS
jgi:hypothetical protein